MRKDLRLFAALVFSLTVGMTPVANAQTRCEDRAQTDYEKLYCKVLTSGASGLPRFEDFQKNNQTIQKILLKPHLKKMGLSMPTSQQPSPRSTRERTPPINSKSAAPTTPANSPAKVQSPTEILAKIEKPRPAKVSGFGTCSLQSTSIHCSHGQYTLLGNQANSRLRAKALSTSNRFELPNFRGNRADEKAVRHYLSSSYSHYIDKMLAIGLAGSTMTYTKFYYTFQELADRGEDFAARFETMYDYLKKDKANMAVKAHYNKSLPSSIKQCQELSERVIVCDDADHNWVYVRS